MTIKEKTQKIIALATSIKATDSHFLSVAWTNNTNRVDIYVHKHINGKTQGVVENYTYNGVTNRDSYVSYDFMTDWLERMKREWGEI